MFFGLAVLHTDIQYPHVSPILFFSTLLNFFVVFSFNAFFESFIKNKLFRDMFSQSVDPSARVFHLYSGAGKLVYCKYSSVFLLRFFPFESFYIFHLFPQPCHSLSVEQTSNMPLLHSLSCHPADPFLYYEKYSSFDWNVY